MTPIAILLAARAATFAAAAAPPLRMSGGGGVTLKTQYGEIHDRPPPHPHHPRHRRHRRRRERALAPAPLARLLLPARPRPAARARPLVLSPRVLAREATF